jgi:hypothetical protein
LREIPGKSAQGRRQAQRFRWSIGFPAIQNPARDEIVRISVPPPFLLLFSASGLTIRISASSLTGTNSWIRTEPTAANAAGFLSGIWHGGPMITTQQQMNQDVSSSFSVFSSVGHFS